MRSLSFEDAQSLLCTTDGRVYRIPLLVKGELVAPPNIVLEKLCAFAGQTSDENQPAHTSQHRWFRLDGAQVLCHPLVNRQTLTPTGEHLFLVLPDLNPHALIERDLDAWTRDLINLPFPEVCAYIGALREVLSSKETFVGLVAQYTKATSFLNDRAVDLFFDILPHLLDLEGLKEAVNRELGNGEASGTRYLDEWVELPAYAHRGVTAQLSEQVWGHFMSQEHAELRPKVRAMPTRQLHITAGNSPTVPLISILRAFASKGAAVIKSPAQSTAAATLLALAMHKVDPRHPLTRYTSLVYWKGGDRRIEDILFAPQAFDRLVVWGSPETVQSVASRAGSTRAVFFNPRYGLSLIGHEIFADDVNAIAARAAADTMIANQQACASSLVHYVEGSETEALAYCRSLQGILAGWDRAVPHTLTRSALAQLRYLRRTEFLHGRWFENGVWPHTKSYVVYMPTPFDLSAHPMSRCVVVRRVDNLHEVLPYIHAGVSTIGVYPERRREELRDALAARGVSNILPLGEGERAYTGMPHDGMRVLSELVNWTNA